MPRFGLNNIKQGWLLTLVFFGTWAGTCTAQRWDSTYVSEFPYRYRVNTGFRYIDDSAEFTTADGQSFQLQNRQLAFRIGGRYKFASYTFSIPISDLGTGTDEEQGSGWGLGLRLYRRYGYFRTQFRFTNGFRLTDPDGTETYRDDLKLFTAYVYAYHLFSEKTFSLRSSFNQRDRQLKSNGSWLAGGLVTRRRFLANNLTIPSFDGQGSAEIQRFAQTNLGVGGGYTYTFVRNRFYATPLIYAGPEVRFTNTQQEAERRMAETVRVGLQLRARLSVGWTGDHYFIALIGDFIRVRTRPSTWTPAINVRRSNFGWVDSGRK